MLSKYRACRRARLQSIDESKIMTVLPRDVPDRIWFEIFAKEETDMIILDIREEIFDEAMNICFKSYMEKQTTVFNVDCAVEAILKIFDWNFYRHDPGEDPTALPECYIPRQLESWNMDSIPDPSPKDTWARQKLKISEIVHSYDRPPPAKTLVLEAPEDIPREYWFPGKVVLPEESESSGTLYDYSNSTVMPSEEGNVSSEVVQNITNYASSEDVKDAEKSKTIVSETSEPTKKASGISQKKDKSGNELNISTNELKIRRSKTKTSTLQDEKVDEQSSSSMPSRKISDCMVKGLRIATHYEVSSMRSDERHTKKRPNAKGK